MGTGPKRALAAVGDVLLTVAAVCGALCIALVIAAVVWKVSIVMFATGSMSPGIPAGSAALVREIPAAEVRVGDVVTVDRPGRLPITHRVVAVAGTGAIRALTLRGDANPVDDPAPYRVHSVRTLLVAVPGAAATIGVLSTPAVLGTLTLVMTAVVLWAFWPTRTAARPAAPAHRASRSPRSSRPSRAGRAAAIAAAVVLAATAVAAASPSPRWTTASWADAETGRAAATSLTVPAPKITACTAQNVVVAGSQITITWTAASGYSGAESEFVAGSSPDLGSALALGSGVTTTGTGPYTSTFSSGVLSGLLGGTIYVGVRTKRTYGSVGWTSTPAVATATVPAVLGTGTCTF